MFNIKKKDFKKFDWLLFISVTFLSIFGLCVLYSAFSGDFLAIRSQIFASILGFLFIILICTMDMDVLKKAAYPIYGVSLLLLILTIFLGQGAERWGSNSWLILGPVQVQPSEITKVGIIFALAAYLEKYKNDINDPSRLLKTLAFAFAPIIFILLQPDFGTAMVYVFFVSAMIFIGGISWKWIGIFAGILGALLGLGGGIVITPVLTLLFGVDIKYAVGASIIAVLATSSGSAIAYLKDDMLNLRIAMFLEIFTTLGAFV
ncbi:MAG: TSUP family transporter, partial [Anaerococcus sp.]|nr:TSUP family transporter [Anaerococcus sp.]